MGWTWLAWLALALMFFWGVGAYNRLLRLRNAIGMAYAQFDEALSQRAALCTQLQTELRPVLVNEQATFDALETAQSETENAALWVRARPYAGDPVAALAVAVAVHAAAVTRLISLVEHHGELSERPEIFAQVDELKLVERHRAFARQVFNKAVLSYNEALQQFPTRILVGIFGFAEARSL